MVSSSEQQTAGNEGERERQTGELLHVMECSSAVLSAHCGAPGGTDMMLLQRISNHESPQPSFVPASCVRFHPFSLRFPPPFILPSRSVTAAMQGSQLENPLIVSDKNRGGDGEEIDGKRN